MRAPPGSVLPWPLEVFLAPFLQVGTTRIFFIQKTLENKLNFRKVYGHSWTQEKHVNIFGDKVRTAIRVLQHL